MQILKNSITIILLIVCLFSLNVYSEKLFTENEMPFLPVSTDEKDEVLNNEQDDNSGVTDNNNENNSNSNNNNNDNNDNDDGNDDSNSNNDSNNDSNSNSNSNNDSNSNSSGGASYRPNKKTEGTSNTQKEVTSPESIGSIFEDVKPTDWFYNDVVYVYNNKIMNGTDEKKFSPDSTLNRAMMITILHRIDGDNSVYEQNIFNDVEKNSWYEKAVSWGYENKIVTGTGASTFDPMDDLTREQLCVMLYNYTKHIGLKTDFADITSFSDSNVVSVWAKKAVSWAVQERIITGKENNILAPCDSASRAEAAAVIKRYMKKFINIKE